MKSHKITRSHLAGKIGISPATLRSWIFWNQVPDVILACKISEILGVTVEYLVGGKDYARKRPKPELINVNTPPAQE